ncbi:unnamed protein product [Didymodactylos carnosus]|uniref:Uncharacterized protein n=1 Tax=Didymodactylos carnosus TaxID=1234261 RepID=A0A8S2WVR6_9BILA|nr:unnamed protein product [Didymodactylos carnosus]
MGTGSSKNNRGRNSSTDLSILLNGSLAEGQFNTKFIGNDSMRTYEFDLMYLLKTEIEDETQLVGVEQTPGYVKIRFSADKKNDLKTILPNNELYILTVMN